ncbi:recombinase family protein [Brevibacillus sp. NRS-1366]|uniref:recombinase family protein n=1 Tax=Brevibacillus sp. NRS-1366 TaxID=3233899 RepID=UPI003D2140F4
MRTAVYMRVSTDDQARDGFSIPAQREKLLSYIHSQAWELADIYADEGVSAKDTNRPALARLLADVRLGKIDVVLVYRLDRLTRSVLDLYQLLQEFEQYGVRFKSSTEVYDTTTAIGRLFITLVAALAQWERENLAERVKMGMGQMVRERKRPGGPPPFGYELVDGQLTVNPAEADGVRVMFEQYARGESPRRIAEMANTHGLRGKNGAMWSASAVLRLLKNPVYYGALRWNYASADQRQNPPDHWILEEETHPAIIDEGCFLRVQKRMTDRSSLHPRTLGSSFLFSGLLFCSRCKAGMRGKTTRTQSTGVKQYIHHYYWCKNKLTGSCNAPAIREDRLEKAIVKELLHYRVEAKAAASEAMIVLQKKGTFVDHDKVEQKRQQKRERWERAYAEGLLSLRALREKLQELKQKKPNTDPMSIASANHPFLPPPDENGLERLTNWELLWSHATEEERKLLIGCLFKRVEAEVCPTENKRSICLRLIHFH